MRRLIGKKWLVAGFLLLITTSGYLTFVFLNQSKDITHYPGKRVIKYSFTMKNQSNRAIESASFWAYLPVKQTEFQKRVKIDFSHPTNIKEDLMGNEKVVFTAHNLPPFGSKVFSISTELDVAYTPNKLAPIDVGPYLQAEKLIESDDPRIIAIAETLKADTMSETAINIYNWVLGNLSDAGYVERDHGALYALDKKAGDCTEFMNLFLALARANGIPSRGVAGYISGESTILVPRDYHNWAEVYIDSVWRIVDPLNKVIFKNEPDYIAMRYLGSSVADEEDNTQRFFKGDGSVQVSMN